MPTFDSAAVPIHYEVFGEGQPIVLVHGFASSLQGNWVRPGWIETLTPLRQVIALDCRGHGESGKPHDPAAYGNLMGDDVIRLMDHLGIEKAELFGYSMGGAISLGLMARYPERFSRVVLGGVGARGPQRGPDSPVARALLTDDPSSIEDPVAKGFRAFAERTGNDLNALGAVNQGDRRRADPETLGKITVPVLIVVGEKDAIAGSSEPLARAIPNARLITIPDKDHLTVVGDQRFKDAVVAFLKDA
jgi:pimeloyl-ACP methyl ester carboxylesterase